jgi:secretion/DNA translocation related TadE-like protein
MNDDSTACGTRPAMVEPALVKAALAEPASTRAKSEASGATPESPGRPLRSRDRGAAGVLIVGSTGAVLVVTAAALALASVVVANQQARLAADLGALAGAAALLDGGSSARACSVAAEVVQANAAVLQWCSSPDGSSINIVVSRKPALWPASALARSRAGPGLP